MEGGSSFMSIAISSPPSSATFVPYLSILIVFIPFQSLITDNLCFFPRASHVTNAYPTLPALITTAHALHARLVSWFFDAPAPFGVHQMALAGKAPGKDVVWAERGGGGIEVGVFFFIQFYALLDLAARFTVVHVLLTSLTLVNAFPAWGLGVSATTDSERERQRIREAERGAPSAPELLTLHEAQQSSPTSHDTFNDAPVAHRAHTRACAPSGTFPCPRLRRHSPIPATTMATAI
ncbi:hypothetical protein C8R47DRAFT_1325949 [Mycena vitilis]|nr:hypothetical protein C8R47DRAFT_1325949 [Mycena vitilis]